MESRASAPLVRLNFSRAKFCGRQCELALLQHEFARISNEHDDPEASTIFLAGDSGCGKSSLIRAFRETVKPNNFNSGSCCFCRGKFEEGQAAVEPFAAVFQAINSMMTQLLVNEMALETWKDRFELELSATDAYIAKNLIPKLQRLLPDYDSDSEDDYSYASCSDPRGSSGRSGKSGSLRYDIHSGNSSVETSLGFNQNEKEWAFERLRFSLRSLIRAVSKYVPLVLFLDDLQWAGEDSLMLIKTLIGDETPNRRLLFIGAFRPVDSTHPLSTSLLRCQGLTPIWTMIHLNNLNEADLIELLASCFQIQNGEHVRSLVGVVYRKTNGNPFFVIQCLRLMEQRGLLFFSENQWQWRSDLVYSKIDISDNVVDVVKGKIKVMSEEQQKALTRAACFGATVFDVDTLMHAMYIGNDSNTASDPRPQDYQQSGELTQSLTAILRSMVEAGFLEEVEFGVKFRFVHDRIREGAYSLLSSEQERAALHLSIGRQMLHARKAADHAIPTDSTVLSDNDDDSRILLQACRQLNLGSSLIEGVDERVKVAETNYEAAGMAARRAAFFPAAQFLATGLDLLFLNEGNATDTDTSRLTGSRSAWQDHYDLMLQLSTARTRMEYSCGRFDRSIACANDVIANAKTMSERKVAYHTKILCLVQAVKSVEARELVLSILAELGLVFPKQFLRFHIAFEFVRTRLMLKGKSDSELLRLPDAENPIFISQVEFLEKLGELTLLSSNPDETLLVLVQLRGIQMTVRHGRFPNAAVSVVGWAMCLAQLGNFREAMRFDTIGVRYAQRRLSGTAGDSRALDLSYAYVRHWQHPYHEGIAPLRRSMQEFWDVGAMDFLMIDNYFYLSCCFVSGVRLEVLRSAALKYAETLKDYSHSLLYDYNTTLSQSISNLMGLSEHTVKLCGEYMDEDQLWTRLQEMPDKTIFRRLHFYRLLLACFFGDFHLAERTLATIPDPFSEGPDVWVPYRFFFEGLTAIALARSATKCIHRRWTYRRKGRAAIRRLQKWANKGAINCIPLLTLLQAEAASVTVGASKFESVKYKYDSAILAADELCDGYYLHLKALANERAGIYCMQMNHFELSAAYLNHAQDLYTDWGATAKVRQIEDTYQHVLVYKVDTVDPDISARLIQAMTNTVPLCSVSFDESETVMDA
jgi:predicted ATPase